MLKIKARLLDLGIIQTQLITEEKNEIMTREYLTETLTKRCIILR